MTEDNRTALLDRRLLQVFELRSLRPPWMGYAACRGTGFALWFPEDEADKGTHAARAVCAACTVRTECLDYAIGARIHHGLWGGLSGRERAALSRRRVKEARRARAVGPGLTLPGTGGPTKPTATMPPSLGGGIPAA